MRADPDALLGGAADGPTQPIDADELWAAGRRRRRRRATALASGVASVAALAVALTALDLGGGPATPEVSPLAPDESAARDEVADESDAADETAPEVPADDLDPPLTSDTDGPDDGDEVEEADPDVEVAVEDGDEPGPQPDAGALADPCAGSSDRQGEAFIEVVAPVAGQKVSATLDLVGCASVYEATVRYRVLAAEVVVLDGFTTATYGGPALGEFRETITLDASGPLTVQVFWESPVDGSEQDLAEIAVEAS